MTHDPPKRAAEPAPNHIALVIRWHVQRLFGLQVKTELLTIKHELPLANPNNIQT
jgi:hypothetical protein